MKQSSRRAEVGPRVRNENGKSVLKLAFWNMTAVQCEGSLGVRKQIITSIMLIFMEYLHHAEQVQQHTVQNLLAQSLQ